MIIPPRCFTCNKVIGHLWKNYKKYVKRNIKDGMTEMDARNQALDAVGLAGNKYCCQRMLLSHVDVIDDMLLYSN